MIGRYRVALVRAGRSATLRPESADPTGVTRIVVRTPRAGCGPLKVGRILTVRLARGRLRPWGRAAPSGGARVLDGDFDVISVTPGVVIVLNPRRGVPAGLSRITKIDIFTARAGSPGWQVGWRLIVRVQ